MPNELSGWKLTELQELSRLPDALLGQVGCFRVQGKVQGSTETLWLDKVSSLVRRIDEILPPGLRTQTTTYAPVIDENISSDLLLFSPPK